MIKSENSIFGTAKHFKVKIKMGHLADFINQYINNLNCFKECYEELVIDNDNLFSNKEIIDVGDFLKIKNRENGDVIKPDGYQEMVIRELIKYIRYKNIKERKGIYLRYPYKQNVLNYYLKMNQV